MRADAIKRIPNGPKMLLAALQDVADVLHKETAAADKIANETLKLPARHSHRRGREQAPDHDRQAGLGAGDAQDITDMMERAVKAGFYEKMPDAKIIYAP